MDYAPGTGEQRVYPEVGEVQGDPVVFSNTQIAKHTMVPIPIETFAGKLHQLLSQSCAPDFKQSEFPVYPSGWKRA